MIGAAGSVSQASQRLFVFFVSMVILYHFQKKLSSDFITFFRNIFIDFPKQKRYIIKKEESEMIKYKINIADALERVKFNTYKAKTSGLLSQDTLKKMKNEDTNVSLKSMNNLCVILDMELKDVISFEMTEEEKENRKRII